MTESVLKLPDSDQTLIWSAILMKFHRNRHSNCWKQLKSDW